MFAQILLRRSVGQDTIFKIVIFIFKIRDNTLYRVLQDTLENYLHKSEDVFEDTFSKMLLPK